MKAPRCPHCGREEWGHLCVGRVEGSEVARRALVGVTKKVRKSPVTKIVEGGVTKKKRGRPKKAGGALTGAERVRKLRALRKAIES